MKKIILVSIIVLSAFACKKNPFDPEGPTDVRIKNLSDVTFTDLIVSTSEKKGDTISFGTLPNAATSGYSRFTKAYPKAEIKAKVNIGGSLVEFTTGPFIYTYMQYIGQEMITYEVYISNMNSHELSISNVVYDAPLVLK
jgi:hypothetical protein